jgi:hypothetical protein
VAVPLRRDGPRSEGRGMPETSGIVDASLELWLACRNLSTVSDNVESNGEVEDGGVGLPESIGDIVEEAFVDSGVSDGAG